MQALEGLSDNLLATIFIPCVDKEWNLHHYAMNRAK
jgi:hypothetical protein